MAAPSTSTSTDAPSLKSKNPDSKTGASTSTNANALDPEEILRLRRERLAINKTMVQKYQSMFPKIPTMTSEELVALWKQIDKMQDERDDSLNSDSEDDGHSKKYNALQEETSPLLLIDVRTKAERAVSMLQGALSMDDLETTKWMNKYVHQFDGVPRGGIPTIVTYCTIGYRSGREAQRLVDELTSTFGIEIGVSVQIKNLDGILAYSFVEDAPPLLRPCRKGSSDSFMTRRIHSYGKAWAEAVDPSFETVQFDSKPKMAKHLFQTGLCSALRMVQHTITKTTHKAKQTTTTVVAKTCVEPVAKLTGTSIVIDKGSNSSNSNHSSSSSGRVAAKRISATGYTSNVATPNPSE